MELRFLSASGRAIDTREVTQLGAALDAPEFEHSDGLRREAFRVALGALADVEPSIVDGTSRWRSLVAEFDRDAGAFGVEFGREADGSPAEEWELDRLDVQRTGIERHLVMRYACTDGAGVRPAPGPPRRNGRARLPPRADGGVWSNDRPPTGPAGHPVPRPRASGA